VKKRRGFAVVEVVNGACRGCHMSLPPQLVNILAGQDTIENCPSCQRLVYTQAMLDAAPAES
jgi:hypothetical protein